jgi:large subunit ribosomal protein L4
MSEPRTKDAVALLEALDLRVKGSRPERVLVVLDRSEEAVWKSFRNLGERVQIILTDELNAYDVLVNDSIVFSRATLTALIARFGGATDVEVEVEVEIEIEPSDVADDGGAE